MMTWKDAAAQLEMGGIRAAQRMNWHNLPGKPLVFPVKVGARWVGTEPGAEFTAFVKFSCEPGMNPEIRRFVPTQDDQAATDWQFV